MNADAYRDEVLRQLGATVRGGDSVSVSLDAFQLEVLKWLGAIMEGAKQEVPIAQLWELIVRAEDLIDAGTEAGPQTLGLLEVVGEARSAIVVELMKTYDDQEAREGLQRYIDLRAARRSPVLRRYRNRRSTKESGVGGVVNRIRGIFRGSRRTVQTPSEDKPAGRP